MQHEFEALAGYEVSRSDYDNIIEPMYLAIPEGISKAEFVKMINKKRFALKPIKAIVDEMKKTAGRIKETCEHYTDYEAQAKLEALAKEYMERKGLDGMAAFMIETKLYRCCHYPNEIVIYSKKTYNTLEVIKIA